MVEQTTVITVLGLIRDEFHLRRDDIYRLRPDDRLMAIYRAAYPRGGADAMEFEGLTWTLHDKFCIPQDELVLPDPTVADIVRLCLRNDPSTPPAT